MNNLEYNSTGTFTSDDDVLRSVMAQCSKWVEGEKHVTITINIHNNILGDIENLYNNLVE